MEWPAAAGRLACRVSAAGAGACCCQPGTCVAPLKALLAAACRPSDSKKKKAALKKGGSKSSLKGSGSTANLNGDAAATGLEQALQEFQLNDRSTTGVLTSHPQSRDVHFESFSLLFHGHVLLQDTTLELNYGRCARPGTRCGA